MTERNGYKLKLIAIGDNVVDKYISLNTFYPGGNALNVAVFARRYGALSAYIGCIGNDDAGQHIYNVLLKEDIDISHIKKANTPNRYAVVKLSNGDRKFLPGGNKETNKKLVLTEEDFVFINKFQIIHTSINSYVEKYLPQLKRLGKIISFDFSDRYDLTYLKYTLPYVDYAFFSDNKPSSLKENKLFLKDVLLKGPKIAVMTKGSNGVLLYNRQNHFFQPAYKTDVVDTLGAGDSFIASFLVNLHNRYNIKESLKKAVKNASETCTYYGAFGYGVKY